MAWPSSLQSPQLIFQMQSSYMTGWNHSSTAGCLHPLPIWSCSVFLSAFRKLALFGFLQWYYKISHQWGLGRKCESSFPIWWDEQSTSETIWIKTALKVLIYFFDCLICGATKYIFLRDCICCFIEKAAQHGATLLKRRNRNSLLDL